MPLALLLGDIVRPLRVGFTRLQPWTTMPFQEELLLDRARGAFLTRWFGGSVPLSGGSVLITIDNVRALAIRYDQIVAESREAAGTGRNLTEPLAGMAGAVAGILISPTVLVALGIGFHTLPGTTRVLLVSLGLMGIGLPIFFGLMGWLPTVAQIGGAALGLGGVAAGMLGLQYRAVIELLGALADLLPSISTFLNLLTGPRDRIQNPLLAQILGLFDSLARLVPFVLAFAAVLFTRIVPFLGNLARRVRPWVDLLRAGFDALTAIAADFMREVRGPFRSGGSLFGLPGRILQASKGLFTGSVDKLLAFLMDAANLFARRAEGAATTVRTYITAAGLAIARVVEPFVKYFSAGTEILAVLSATRAAYLTSPPSSTTPPSSGGSFSIPSWVHRIPTAPPPPPPLPTFPATPPPPPLVPPGAVGAVADMLSALQPASVLSPEARAAVARIRNPPSIFGPEWAALARRRAAARSPETLRIYEQEQPLRDFLVGFIDRNIPAAARRYLPSLAGILRRLDAEISAHPERLAPITPFPVVVPEEPVLQPDVGRMRLRVRLGSQPPTAAPGSPPPEVRVWAESLRRRLVQQAYPVPGSPGTSAAPGSPTAGAGGG